MSDHYYQFFPGNILENGHDLDARLRIECAGRLIRQNDIGIIDQSSGDRYSLDLSAGHLGRLLIDLITESDLLKGGDCPLPPLACRYPGQSQR